MQIDDEIFSKDEDYDNKGDENEAIVRMVEW